MWSRVYCKKTPCWLWHAIDHDTGDIVAYVFGTRSSETLEELGALLKGLNLNIVGVFFDDNFTYHEVIPADILRTDKWNTQRI
ncbi:MAG: hypothetical protein LBQ98_07620 [Nitrososphaerota archaeon]|jgi:insertion element IS1 protein InsB|nr:hypothetical protein [Nitrososphaerota archaeon]